MKRGHHLTLCTEGRCSGRGGWYVDPYDRRAEVVPTEDTAITEVMRSRKVRCDRCNGDGVRWGARCELCDGSGFRPANWVWNGTLDPTRNELADVWTGQRNQKRNETADRSFLGQLQRQLDERTAQPSFVMLDMGMRELRTVSPAAHFFLCWCFVLGYSSVAELGDAGRAHLVIGVHRLRLLLGPEFRAPRWARVQAADRRRAFEVAARRRGLEGKARDQEVVRLDRCGWTQEEIGRAVGVDQATVSRALRGRRAGGCAPSSGGATTPR